jgi:cystathionine beta-lyase/cystathionine gamma-synthase
MTPDHDHVREFARSYTDAWRTHDPTKVAEHYASGGTIAVNGGPPAEITEVARSFMTASNRIPFCPSLGELTTTLSHPESTSHRGLTTQARQALGITSGTIRLSLGIESAAMIIDAIGQGLDSAG